MIVLRTRIRDEGSRCEHALNSRAFRHKRGDRQYRQSRGARRISGKLVERRNRRRIFWRRILLSTNVRVLLTLVVRLSPK
jgi:hypothetical protein